MFEFKNITYSLGFEHKRRVQVSGKVNAREALVVKGSSGSGKTTLFRIMARLQACEEGEALLNGTGWHEFPATEWRLNVHYLPQHPVLFHGTVLDNLKKPFETRIMSRFKFDLDKARSLMQQLQLPESLLHQDARTLSGGEAARLALIRALLINPKILLLDEPTANLDDKARRSYYQVLTAWLQVPGHAVCLISHHDDYNSLDSLVCLELASHVEEAI